MSGYSFKYLLYDATSPRFTYGEAVRLREEINSHGGSHPLLIDISTRSAGYRKKLLKNLRRHAVLLKSLIKRVERIDQTAKLLRAPDERAADRHFNERANLGTAGSVRTVSGGLPSLGKRR